MRKFLLWTATFVLCVSTVFSFAGCKPAAPPVVEETEAVETIETTEETAEVEETTAGAIGPIAEITKEPITINMWMISGNVNWVNLAADKVKEKYPNVDFNITIQSDEFIDTNVITTLGSKPKDLDITFFWSGTRVHKLVENESVLNLDSWFEHYGWDDIYHPGAFPTNIVEGFGHAAFNYGWYAFTPLYNKKLFEQAGVTPPTTMDEWWETCEKIKNAGIEVVAMGGKDAWPLHLLWNVVLGRYTTTEEANKLSGFSLIPGRTAEDAEVFKSEAAKNAWQFLVDMKTKGYFSPGVNSLDWLDSNDRFASGKAAMIIGFVPFTFVDAKAQDPNFPVDYFIMPDTDKSDGGVVVSYNDVFVIPVGVEEAKKPILAEFLNIIFTDKDVIRTAILDGINPSHFNVTPDEVVEISKNEALGRFFEEMKGKPILINTDVNISLPLVKEYYDLLMEVTEGVTTPDQACQIMYDRALEEVE